jgi:protein-S-isoprenylcysteine O-methyltransferase Ste14
LELYTLVAVELELGGRRLVGHAELTGRGQLTTRGLYTRVRHPRYLGMMAAVLGGCLLVGSLPLWIAGALWLLLALFTIQLEERELRVRFGSAYADYAERVPALLPFRFRS